MKRGLTASPGRLAAGLSLFVLCALPALVMDHLFGWLPLLFLSFLAVLSLVYALLISGAVSCRFVCEGGRCLRGEAIPLKLMVKNSGPLLCIRCRPHFILRDGTGAVCAEETLSFSLAPGEERLIPFQTEITHVGLYHTGVDRVLTDGLFGALSVSRRLCAETELEVCPKVHPLARLTLSEQVRSESERASQLSTMESLDYAGVRDYAYGDPIKRIHWKLSSHSHTGGYMTKLLESYGTHGLTLLVHRSGRPEQREAALTANDILLECAVSLSRHARQKGMETEWIFFDRSGNRQRKQDDGCCPAELLAYTRDTRTETDGSHPLSELLSGLRRSLTSNLAVCTDHIDEAAATELLRLQQAGNGSRVLLFLASPPEAGEPGPAQSAALHLLRGRGVTAFLLKNTDELDKVVRV